LTRRLLENGLLLDPEASEATAGSLLIDGGRIVGRPGADEVGGVVAERIDLGGLWVSPGFLDVHYHGDMIFRDAGSAHDALLSASALLVRHGVTGFLPTTVAWPAPEMTQRMTHLESALISAGWAGALPLGLHLEGPWISTDATGAQPESGVRAFEAEEGQRILDARHGAARIRMVTFAPEVEGAGLLQKILGGQGIVMAMGHSAASAEQAERAIDRGASHVTHLWNAMSGVHHRAPGLAGVALADDRLSCDLICDGVHVDARAVRIAARAKGRRLALISDRIELPPGGATSFGSGPVVDDGVVLRLSDGTLAGSRLGFDTGVRNLQQFAGWSLLQAVAAGSLVPARVLSIESERGTLRSGARADLALLDASGQVRETWISGRRVYPAWKSGPSPDAL
jgi:N-acetylglucosamine-6-phosphate deacetylase